MHSAPAARTVHAGVGLLTTPAAIRSAFTALTAFGDLGADEVVCYCHGLDPDQVDRLADLLQHSAGL